MPLLKGKSNDIVRTNMKELRRSGKSEDQSWAIAMDKAGKGKKKKKKKSFPPKGKETPLDEKDLDSLEEK